MPSANGFAFVRDSVRSHPVIVATSAASIGVLLGGFVVATIFAPVKPVESAPQVAAETKTAPKPAPETTGSAPVGEAVASVDCDAETWPNLSRPCMEQMRKRSVRVISTDKSEKPPVGAAEAQPAASAGEQKSPPPAAAVAAAPPPTAEPAKAAVAPPKAAAAPAPAAPVQAVVSIPPASIDPAIFAAPVAKPSPLAPAAAQAAEAPPAVAKIDEVKPEQKEKRTAKKAKRKPKTEPAPAGQDDEAEDTVATRVSDDRDERADRRPAKRRIVERWTEREYNVRSDNGDGERRVTVRRSGGGLFETIFGFGRGSRDDDED